MNWEYIIIEVFATFFKCGLIFIAYKLSKSYASEKSNSDCFGKTIITFEVLAIVVFIAAIVTAKMDITKFVINILTLSIPTLWGLNIGFGGSIPIKKK